MNGRVVQRPPGEEVEILAREDVAGLRNGQSPWLTNLAPRHQWLRANRLNNCMPCIVPMLSRWQ